jgi:hypothetical protein
LLLYHAVAGLSIAFQEQFLFLNERPKGRDKAAKAKGENQAPPGRDLKLIAADYKGFTLHIRLTLNPG